MVLYSTITFFFLLFLIRIDWNVDVFSYVSQPTWDA